jgi:hypothetical protein
VRGISKVVGIMAAVVAALFIAGVLLALVYRINIPGFGQIAELQLPEIAEEFTDVSFTDVTVSEADTTSTEVACGIGTKLLDNFGPFGYQKRDVSASYTILSNSPRRSLISAGIFRISINPFTNEYWTYDDLPDATKSELTRTCSETGTLTPCTKPFVDEKCLTANLENRKLGDNYLCTGIKDAKVIAGGVPVDFGNIDCGGIEKVADGADTCMQMCSAPEPGNGVRAWIAPGGNEGADVYVSDADLKKPYQWPPHQCFGHSGGACPSPLYEWALLYYDAKNAKDKGYEVVIGQVAEKQDLGTKDVLALADEIAVPAKEGRSQEVGEVLRDMRRVALAEVRPASKVSLSELATRLASDIGDGWTFKFLDPCVFEEDCLASKVEPKTWRVGVGPGKEWDLSTKCDSKKKELHTFNVKTNVDPNGALEPDHSYLIALTWWAVTTNTGVHEPGCSGVGVPGNCGACVEGSCTIHYRWGRDCDWVGGDIYDQTNEYSRWQDYTLSVVDLGEVQAAAPPAAGS